MHIFTSHYYQQGRNDSALLLQQYEYRRTSVCLICLIPGQNEPQGRAGAYVTGQLLQWFRTLSLRKLDRSPENSLAALEEPLRALIRRTDGEMRSCGLTPEGKNTDLAGMLCAGEQFLLFSRGGQGIYLLNRSFGRGYVRNIGGEMRAAGARGLVLRQGSLQEEVGILFATESFCGQVKERELREGLYVEEVLTEPRAARHLWELGRQAEERGGRNMGAALMFAGQAVPDGYVGRKERENERAE